MGRVLGASMKLPRRKFLRLAAGAAALPAMPRLASALDYPNRPVRLLVGYPPGGPNDIIARLTGQWLSQRLGQQVVIENRPGAGSNLATDELVRASPDGYTLLEASGSNAWNAALYEKLDFDFIHDTAPVASTVRTVSVLEVNPSFPARSVPEFIAYAKAHPGKINAATAGPGSAPHLYVELFKMLAGVDLVDVSYRGAGPALIDLLSGRVQVMFDAFPSSIEHIRARRLRPLAVTSATPSELLPDIPALNEFVPGYEATGWQGIVAPKGTATEVIEKLNREINLGIADPRVRARLAALGVEPFASSPAEFGRFIIEYTEKWAKLIRAARIRVQ